MPVSTQSAFQSQFCAWIKRPDGLGYYAHLRYCPRGVDPWCGWRTHLKNLARERPQFRRTIEEDRRFLEQQEAEEAAEVEMGEFLPVAMPPKVIALLEEAAISAEATARPGRPELADSKRTSPSR